MGGWLCLCTHTCECIFMGFSIHKYLRFVLNVCSCIVLLWVLVKRSSGFILTIYPCHCHDGKGPRSEESSIKVFLSNLLLTDSSQNKTRRISPFHERWKEIHAENSTTSVRRKRVTERVRTNPPLHRSSKILTPLAPLCAFFKPPHDHSLSFALSLLFIPTHISGRRARLERL